MNKTPLFKNLRSIAKEIENKHISPTEITKYYLNRLNKLGPEYNSVVTVTNELALKQAEAAEKEIMSGVYRGTLHGIPYGAKDLLATDGGIPTTWGAEPFRHQTFQYNATVINKLCSSGAILVAKLAMVELAGGMGYRQPNASLTGPCKSPWDKNTWAGGSSSGSGSAVGTGLVSFAIGSETWGSILSPANNCGVSGLRPTFGRVSRYGAMALSWSLDKIGPLCLSADDCGIVLNEIAGPDSKDPSSSDKPYEYSVDSSQRKFKLAVLASASTNIDEEVAGNFEESLVTLSQFCEIEEINFPDYPYEAITRTIMLAESGAIFEEFSNSGTAALLTAPEDKYGPYARTAVLAKDYLKALRLRDEISQKIDPIMSKYDAVCGPTRGTPASNLEDEFRGAIRGNTRDTLGALGNSIGLPAISVPNGFTKANLPTGIQFVGQVYAENSVLNLANRFQQQTDWHLKHPAELLEEK
ncbi:MAG: amidase [SAR202 cluster bacterium]|nr:amidase [SAR202 cluster bacterium]